MLADVVTMAPSVAKKKNGTIPDFQSSCHHPQPERRSAAAALWEDQRLPYYP
jgi:hypothetical protein